MVCRGVRARCSHSEAENMESRTDCGSPPVVSMQFKCKISHIPRPQSTFDGTISPPGWPVTVQQRTIEPMWTRSRHSKAINILPRHSWDALNDLWRTCGGRVVGSGKCYSKACLDVGDCRCHPYKPGRVEN